jgi:hypothetical protein
VHQGPLIFTIGCKFCDNVHFYVVTKCRIYYITHKLNTLLRATIYFKTHFHPLKKHECGGYGRDRLRARFLTHWGKNSLIVLCTSKSFLSRHLLNKDELVEGNKVIKNSNDHLQPSLAQQRACGPRGKKNVIDAIV